jgi:hypothetical protein
LKRGDVSTATFAANAALDFFRLSSEMWNMKNVINEKLNLKGTTACSINEIITKKELNDCISK